MNPRVNSGDLSGKEQQELKRRWQAIEPLTRLPEKLVCDRGADLTSRDLEQSAFRLGIELDFNPPGTLRRNDGSKFEHSHRTGGPVVTQHEGERGTHAELFEVDCLDQ